jgi:hypothetical protein
VLGRFSGAEYRMEIAGERASYAGDGFTVSFATPDPAGTIEGRAETEIDLTYFEIMNRLRTAILTAPEVNYINCLDGGHA